MGMASDLTFVRSSTAVSDPENPVIGQWITTMNGEPFEIQIKTDGFIHVKQQGSDEFTQFVRWTEAGKSFEDCWCFKEKEKH